ncbi:hypothetical protein CRYO30217_02141 [Parvicella tangerina]|uniref:Uncharacterized protein n=1 Tax=Parvicella tangerina TaxID=2829795 RepID=A0A916JN76_9FLAO|nr:hypothetical protein CRYO30217_02141 [Parvicella tangerina]
MVLIKYILRNTCRISNYFIKILLSKNGKTQAKQLLFLYHIISAG